ncbi:hypothetical protein Dsin_008365 [Dipteronia sinensis]|uniref:hAT-like transposase RNase-H fold domain-containing protein n=1 Tax=Dipteronia sinensis TaxID=43782 RepID=A0AAE0APH8_9ROSI|nr:hypothetical protein Dsin_008365 [Dipteronia sinensis]
MDFDPNNEMDGNIPSLGEEELDDDGDGGEQLEANSNRVPATSSGSGTEYRKSECIEVVWPPPHDGVSLADKVKSLLFEWGIDKRIFSITLDNASSNNSLVHNLKDPKRGLRQYVPTRWNSTYLMLDSAIYYRIAFIVLALADSSYNHCHFTSEWETVGKLCKFLRHFYNTTSLFFGTKYPTSNLYMPKVFMTYLTLMQKLESKDLFFKTMSNQMYSKFTKYWADFSTILAIGIILDPRYKMEFVQFVCDRLYGAESEQLEVVKMKLLVLFNEYVTGSTMRSIIRSSSALLPSTSSGLQTVDDLNFVLKLIDKKVAELDGDIVFDVTRSVSDYVNGGLNGPTEIFQAIRNGVLTSQTRGNHCERLVRKRWVHGKRFINGFV